MNVDHGCGKVHEVHLGDDGTMDTVVEVDGWELRFAEADWSEDGRVRPAWLREAAVEACGDGLFGPDEEDEG